MMRLRTCEIRERSLILMGIVWAITISIGLLWLFEYQTTAVSSGNSPLRWPTSSRFFEPGARLRLVMSAHPKCPCTRASIESLARIMAGSHGRVLATVLFWKPATTGDDWEQTDLWRSASAIPSVDVVSDEEGRIGQQFGMQSSGHVVLYDQQCSLLFTGGITAGRGHHGDNTGLNQCIALINGTSLGQQNTPVFGCSLNGPSDIDVEGDLVCRGTN